MNNKQGWEESFDKEFAYLGEDEYDLNRKGIKAFIRHLLQEERDRLRAKIEEMKVPVKDPSFIPGNIYGYNKSIDDIIYLL